MRDTHSRERAVNEPGSRAHVRWIVAIDSTVAVIALVVAMVVIHATPSVVVPDALQIGLTTTNHPVTAPTTSPSTTHPPSSSTSIPPSTTVPNTSSPGKTVETITVVTPNEPVTDNSDGSDSSDGGSSGSGSSGSGSSGTNTTSTTTTVPGDN